MARLLIAVLFSALGASAGAQDVVYKYVEKDGRVVYTDDPKAGGGRARVVEDQTSVIAAPPPVSAASRPGNPQAVQSAAALDRAVDDIAAATNELRAAEERRNQGIEPIEGDRQGRRYRPEYFQRQEALQRDVDIARNRLEAANQRRNALR